MLEALTAQHFDIDGPDAASILARNASEKMGISGIGATSYLGYYTNIHWLNELYEQIFPSDSSYIQGAIYVEGIGTRAGEPDSLVGIGLGTAETGIIAKTDDAVAQLAKTIETTLASLKGSLSSIRCCLISSASAAARQRHAILPIGYRLKTALLSVPSQQVCANLAYRGIPAGKTRFLGIMDTVAAVGTVANGLDPHSADTGSVNIQLRPGVAQKVFHLTAQHECRYNFALNSIARLAGTGAPRRAFRYRRRLFAATAGRPLSYAPAGGNPAAKSARHSRMFTSRQSRNCTCWDAHPPSCPLYGPVRSPPKYGKTTGYPTTTTANGKTHIRRPDPAPPDGLFDWSKVALRVMFDAAVEAGAILADVDKVSTHRLPDELKAFSDHARLMGKAARQGKK
jgi:hypothetical protein